MGETCVWLLPDANSCNKIWIYVSLWHYCDEKINLPDYNFSCLRSQTCLLALFFTVCSFIFPFLKLPWQHIPFVYVWKYNSGWTCPIILNKFLFCWYKKAESMKQSFLSLEGTWIHTSTQTWKFLPGDNHFGIWSFFGQGKKDTARVICWDFGYKDQNCVSGLTHWQFKILFTLLVWQGCRPKVIFLLKHVRHSTWITSRILNTQKWVYLGVRRIYYANLPMDTDIILILVIINARISPPSNCSNKRPVRQQVYETVDACSQSVKKWCVVCCLLLVRWFEVGCTIWELLEIASQKGVSQIKSPTGRVFLKYVYSFIVKMRIAVLIQQFSKKKKQKAKKALFEEKKSTFWRKKSTFCGAFYYIFWFEIKSCFSDYSLIMAKM